MNGNSQEDQFAAYEMDFSLFEQKPQRVDDQEMDFSQYELKPKQEDVVEKPLTEETTIIADSANSLPGEEDVLPAEEDTNYEDDEEEEEEAVTPLTSSELKDLTKQQAESAALCQTFLDLSKYIAAKCDEDNMPRGLRTVIRDLTGTHSVFVATKLLYDTYTQMDVEPLLQTIAKSKLKKMGVNASRTLNAHAESLTANLNQLDDLVDNGEDRATLSLHTRLIRQQTKALADNAQKQAEAFSKTLDAFPLENGQLVMLQLFNENGDSLQIECVDRTMQLSETAQSLTADATEMLQAVQQKDMRVIAALQKKMIETTHNKDL